MIDNLQKNTGKSLDQWTALVKAKNFEKHGEILKFLKEDHGLSHGFANLIALKAKGSHAGSAENPDDLITKQYQGKESQKPIYDKLIAGILAFGDDIEIAPKNTYVSLRRKKQFAILNPATKTRFEVGINLKGREPKGMLVAEKPGSMCTHKINIADLKDINDEVMQWIRTSYNNAG